MGVPHGSRTPCQGAGMPCGGACDGVNLAACTNTPPTTICGTSCADGKETDSRCDDHGMCIQGTPVACPGGLACDATVKCKTSCASDSDCITGFTCDGSHCNPKGGSVCVDDHTVADSSGKRSACDPYKCVGGACLPMCHSVDDCVAPAVCNPSGACVAPQPASSGSSGGCALGGAHGRSAGRGWGLAAVVVLAGLRWKRRARRR